MPDSNFYGTLYRKHVREVSESSDNFQIGGISYLGSYRPFITQKKKLFRLWGSWYSKRPA